MPPRSYYYKDEKGVLKKFVYCSMCGKGPFKESQKNFEYLSLHGKASHNYCIPCAKNAGLSTAELMDKSHQVAREKVEEVVFKNEDPIETSPVEIPLEKPPESEPLEPVPPEPKPEKEEEKGPFYVYIGQFTDNTYITGVTKDMKGDMEKINAGINLKLKKLPMEILYFHVEDNKQEALSAKEAIMLMNYNQKEELIQRFTKEYFKK